MTTYFRQIVTTFTENDSLALYETFLRDNEESFVEGHKFIGHNRTTLHKNAKRGLGGIGLLIKWPILEKFDNCLDKGAEDFL